LDIITDNTIMINTLSLSAPKCKSGVSLSSKVLCFDPGTVSTQQKVGIAPSDAIILFDGTNLDQWSAMDGGHATFTTGDGNLGVEKGHGGIPCNQSFGDILGIFCAPLRTAIWTRLQASTTGCHTTKFSKLCV
jgi:hypothetical protein